MAFAAALGVDFSLDAVIMADALLPVEEKPVARIGIGSTALDAKEDALTNGNTPNLYLFDVRGDMFARHTSSDPIEDGTNEKKSFFIVEGAEKTTAPEYLTIKASSSDATCVTYVTVTGAAGDERTWHAGYLKKCAAKANSNIWYPSPNTVPGTDFRPGCVWLSNDDRFLQGVSVHLPSFGFPEDEKAMAAAKQFDEFPDTLCKAPGRMSLYSTLDSDYVECFPFYDKALEKFSKDEKNETIGHFQGFDKDFQRVVDGHVLPDRTVTLRRPKDNPMFPDSKSTVQCDYSKHKLFNQLMEPGSTPGTNSPQAQKKKEQEEKDAEEKAAEERKKAEEERVRLAAQEKLNLAGKNPNGAAPGTDSFGGFVGSIPADQSGQFVPVGETVENLLELQRQQPSPAEPNEPADPESTVDPDEIEFDLRRTKRNVQQREKDINMLARREQLRKMGDHCVDRLTVSHFSDHSAREVCEMSNSWGPDFVSTVEGLYCDMCERELYPVCAHAHQQDCFDIDTKVLRSRESLWKRAKKYIDVQVWR